MKFSYKPKTNLEKFGAKVYNLLVENFPQTFFVGGMVRDLLLRRSITDIDIATSATPEKVARLLSAHNIKFNNANQKFGSIVASHNAYKVEITTLRTESYRGSRYPKVSFTANPKLDSNRRDFTVNSLYLSPKRQSILDYHNGILDIKKRSLKFIGNPERRVEEDPLRIIRVLRFAVTLDFKIEKKSLLAVKKHFNLLKNLTAARTETEIKKLPSKILRKKIKMLLDGPKALDKFK